MPVKREQLADKAATVAGNTQPDKERELDEKYSNKAEVGGVNAEHTVILTSLMAGLALAVSKIKPEHCDDQAKDVISRLFSQATTGISFSWARKALIEAGPIKETTKIAEMEFIVKNHGELIIYWR